VLYELTPLPDEKLLPDGWRETVASYYLGAENLGEHFLASLSRSLEIDEGIFRDAFNDWISTLRLLHYPDREDDGSARGVEHNGKTWEQAAGTYVDSDRLTF
jgi:isopenicillin N synthase-like dioxygenase